MQSLTNIQKIKIRVLFDFPETNSKITKKFCNSNKGSIPVYASSRDEKSTLGFIQNNLKGVKYYENCLSWNRNGSVGYVFIRDHKFTTNEDHRALIIKQKYYDKLDKLYLKFEIERQLFLCGFSYLHKCGVDKIKDVQILIPVNNNGAFDLKKQRELAKKYLEIQNLKLELSSVFNSLIKSRVDISSKYETKLVPVTRIFSPKKGNSTYTKKYIHEHKGEYPLYSSQTVNFGEIGKIDTFDYEKECLSWTTDGVHAGTVFYRNGKFSITTHAGILELRQMYKGKIDFEYSCFILGQVLPSRTLGEGANKRLGIERMSEIYMEIPINKNGEFNLKRQKEMAQKYYKIDEIKEKLKEDYISIINSRVQII